MTETIRLYYEDSHCREFDAMVLSCRENDGRFEIVLDRSAFYPEGGGQSADGGTLNGIAVTDVQERAGELIHFTGEALAPGTKVKGVLDWEKRFDLMQQHSGEHMLSGLVFSHFGYHNVGFHMASDVVTVDFDGILTEADLEKLEGEVNREIWKNREVRCFFPDEEELRTLPYRSKKELSGAVRLVEFPEVDLCACCGTHVKYTGEIGMVKILSCVRFREGVRLEMIAGERVFKRLCMLQEQTHQISVMLSVPQEETASAVRRVQEEVSAQHMTITRLEGELNEEIAKACEGRGSVLLFRQGLSADGVRRLCDAVMNTCHGCCSVFSENPDGSYKYAIGEIGGDLRAFVKEMNQALNGRGGGKPFFAQGAVKADEKTIRAFYAR